MNHEQNDEANSHKNKLSEDGAPMPNGAHGKSPAIKDEAEVQAGQELTQLQEQVIAAKHEASESYDKYLRALAELENLKRRTEREKSDLRKYGLEAFLKDMLPVLDSFDKALGNDDAALSPELNAETRSFLTGMQLVKRQLLESLERQGLCAVQAQGARFDPNLHQAIQRLESPEVSEEVVGAEYSRGYTLHGRLLRPAMVSVMVPVSTSQEG